MASRCARAMDVILSSGSIIASMPAPRHFRSPVGLFEQSARKLYSGTLQRLGFVPHVVRAQGARFVVDPSDFIDRCIALYGMWDEAQLEELAALARRRKIDVFLDIGANTGFYSIMFAIKNLAERIIAFEPDPGNFARLMANLKANDLASRIETVPLAIGDADSRGDALRRREIQPRRVHHRRAGADAAGGDIPGAAGALRRPIRVRRQDPDHQDGRRRLRVPGARRHGAHLARQRLLLQIEHYGERHEELKARMAGFGYRYLHTHDIDLFFTNMPDIG